MYSEHLKFGLGRVICPPPTCREGKVSYSLQRVYNVCNVIVAGLTMWSRNGKKGRYDAERIREKTPQPMPAHEEHCGHATLGKYRWPPGQCIYSTNT
jgi:hypothetical protein